MTIDWKLCPAGCGEEYGKMLEMKWKTADGEEKVFECCPLCAHTIRGLAFLANEIPVDGANLIPLRAGLAKVVVGPRHFLVGDDHPESIFVKDSFGGEESSVRVWSSLTAWLWIKRRLATVTTPDLSAPAAPKTPAGRSALLKRVLDGKKKAT